MPVKSLGGIFIRVTNLEQSITFYSALGLRLRGIEEWDPGRGATFFPNPEHDGWPLMTLIESAEVQGLTSTTRTVIRSILLRSHL